MKIYQSGFTFFPYVVPWPVFVLDPWALPVLLPSSVEQTVVHCAAWGCSETRPSVSTAEHYEWQDSKCSICGNKKEKCRVICCLFISIFCDIFNLISVLTSIQQANRREQSLLLLPLHLLVALQQCLTDLMCDCCFSIVCIINCCPSLNPW